MSERAEYWLWGLAAIMLLATAAIWLVTAQWAAVLIVGFASLFMIVTVAVKWSEATRAEQENAPQPRDSALSAPDRLPQNATLSGQADATGNQSVPPMAVAAPLLEALLEALPEAALIVEQGRIVRSNQPARRLLGEHIDEADLRLAIRHPAALALLTADAAAGPAAAELVGLGAPGQSWQLRAVPLTGGRALATFSDLSAVRAAERMRTDFVANASHELRTPLAAITGFIETLADPGAGADGPTRERFLAIMDKEARRMLRLVEDLISLSRIEADKYRMPEAPVPLAALAEEVSAVLRDSQRPRGQDIAAVESPAEPLLVRGDRAQLSQLMHNLIDNALKYGAPGTPVRVAVRGAPGGMAALSVSDEGEGIAPEHLPRLTERFYRVDSGRSRAMGGTGLGLAIVKHIIERHRGHHHIDSAPGRGTTVHVFLPLFSPLR